MIDRAVQAIYQLGLDPVVEAQSDPNEFGFRKNRSTHDAITAIRIRRHIQNEYWRRRASPLRLFAASPRSALIESVMISY